MVWALTSEAWIFKDGHWEEPRLRRDVGRLSAAGAEFDIVGAHALAAHGRPRATGDLDIWIRPTAENAQQVWRALLTFGAPLSELRVEDLSTPEIVFQVGIAPARIDILTSSDRSREASTPFSVA